LKKEFIPFWTAMAGSQMNVLSPGRCDQSVALAPFYFGFFFQLVNSAGVFTILIARGCHEIGKVLLQWTETIRRQI